MEGEDREKISDKEWRVKGRAERYHSPIFFAESIQTRKRRCHGKGAIRLLMKNARILESQANSKRHVFCVTIEKFRCNVCRTMKDKNWMSKNRIHKEIRFWENC